MARSGPGMASAYPLDAPSSDSNLAGLGPVAGRMDFDIVGGDYVTTGLTTVNGLLQGREEAMREPFLDVGPESGVRLVRRSAAEG
jgi:hypothetical protein